ncbi:MAG: Maf-like protein [Rhizobiaceae bacterium]
MNKIILASGSRHRAKLLADVGIEFLQIPSTLDERSIEAPLEKANVLPGDRAEILAEAKAIDVSEKNHDRYVIGCDQILSLNNEVLHKPKDMEAARRRLLLLSGKTHFLYSAVVLVKDGKTVWRYVTPCAMTMRPLTADYIGRHLAEAGEDVLSCVGAYQVEGLGAQLFEKIEGDIFSIIGLPLLPLLEALRSEGIIDG